MACMSLSMSKALVASASPRPASRNARSSPASSTSSRWRKNEATATDRWSRWHEPRSRARVSSAADSRADARSLPPLSFRRAPGPQGPGAQGWCVSPRDLSIDDLSSKRQGAGPPLTRSSLSLSSSSSLPLSAVVSKATVAKAQAPTKAVLSAAVVSLAAQALPALAVVRARSARPTPRASDRSVRRP